MKRGLAIFLSASMICLGLGSCVSDLLFFVAPFLT